MAYSYTVVVNSLNPYLPLVILLVYTPVGEQYPQFSLFILLFAVRGVALKRGSACNLGGRFLYSVQPFVKVMPF